MRKIEKKRLPRFPRVLWRELDQALSATDSLGHEKRTELLAKFRRNKVKYMVAWSVSDTLSRNLLKPVEGIEALSLEEQSMMDRLDKAFQALHRYRNGGADEYVAIDVDRMINSLRASHPRKRQTEEAEIWAYLQRMGYESSDNKKAIVMAAQEYFEKSESTVRRAIPKRKTAVT